MTRMSRGFCVDASVGAKWFLDDETHCVQARQLAEDFLLGRCELTVPGLFFYELGNILSLAVRAGRVAPEWALEALDALKEMDLDIVDAGDNLEIIFAMSHRFGLSFYDAAYVAVAETSGHPLITADEWLYKATHQELPFVTLLGAE